MTKALLPGWASHANCRNDVCRRDRDREGPSDDVIQSIKTDVANAGAKWEDSEVVVDKGVITSRNPGDLEAFSAKIIEEV